MSAAKRSKAHTYDQLRLTSKDAPSLFPISPKRTISGRFKPESHQELNDLKRERGQIHQMLSADKLWTAKDLVERNSRLLKNSFREIRVVSTELQRLREIQKSTPDSGLDDADLDTEMRKLESVREVLEEQNQWLTESNPFEEALATMMSPETPLGPEPHDNDMLLIRLVNDVLYSSKSSTLKKGGAGTALKPEEANRHGFAQRAHEYYGTIFNSGSRYCHVLGEILDQPLIKVAHIIPLSLRDLNIQVLLGTNYTTTTINEPRNSLCLHKKIEAQFDKGRALIVPINHSQPIEFKLIVLDKSLLNQNITTNRDGQETLWKNINGRVLNFHNSNRPSLTGLWLRFITRYLSTNQEEREVIEEALKGHGNPHWYTPIPLTKRRGVLQHAAQRLGVEFKNLEAISGDAIFPEDDGELDLDAQEMAGNLLARRIRHVGSEDRNIPDLEEYS